MKIVLLGPPGAGKGTQAERLVEAFSFEHLSTGDLFRNAYRKGDPLGIRAHEAISKGELVADDVVVTLVEKWLDDLGRGKNVLFDGFPRTRDQAVALDDMLTRNRRKLDAVVLIAVDSDVLVERLENRRLCRDCGRSYHLRFKTPQVEGKCDVCGGELYQREDDRPEAIRKRFEVYEKDTAPLVDYYREKEILIEVDGSRSMEEVSDEIHKAISGLLQRGS